MERSTLTIALAVMVMGMLFFSFLAVADYRPHTWPFAVVASACAIGLGLAGRERA